MRVSKFESFMRPIRPFCQEIDRLVGVSVRVFRCGFIVRPGIACFGSERILLCHIAQTEIKHMKPT